jgi:hypothetical protein
MINPGEETVIPRTAAGQKSTPRKTEAVSVAPHSVRLDLG